MSHRDLSGARAVWFAAALLSGACFRGDFVRGLACERDADCGAQHRCAEGLCGGPGDAGLCGNGLLDAGEDCDDGNVDDADACTAACVAAACGDGVVQPGNMETCDDGNMADGDECSSTCVVTVCGDGVVAPGEACDDGNTADRDACTPACRLPVCGDGFVAPGEQCDEGEGTGACTPSCRLPACNDGIVQAGEVCDDGNADETDACTSNCKLSPEAPTLALSLAKTKQFRFSWAPAPGAAYYQLFESAAAGAEFVQKGGDILGLEHALTVPLHLRSTASYKLRACNALARCEDSQVVPVTGALVGAIGYLKATNAGIGDFAGVSVALSGDGRTLAFGASYEDSTSTGVNGTQNDDGFDEGAVYVHVREGETWVPQAYVKSSTRNYHAYFGYSVALSEDGDTLVVGAYTESNGATGVNGDEEGSVAEDSGAVYVFERMGGRWEQQAYIKASNTGAGDYFGHSVALAKDGDTLAVGAHQERGTAKDIDGVDDDNGSDVGAVYVFARQGATWSQQAYVKSPVAGNGDQFGFDVALSGDGDTLAVGVPYEYHFFDGGQIGAVHVFGRTGATWSPRAQVTASNPGGSDLFGFSVALSDDGAALAVGAYGEDGETDLIDGEPDDDAEAAGAVYVFARAGDDWSQEAYVKAFNSDAHDNFGADVALSGSGGLLAVGARGEASDAIGVDGGAYDDSVAAAGAVYVYARGVDAVWSPRAYVKASHSDETDTFGRSVALSTDGESLAVGAPEENYANYDEDPGLVLLNSGAVYVY